MFYPKHASGYASFLPSVSNLSCFSLWKLLMVVDYIVESWFHLMPLVYSILKLIICSWLASANSYQAFEPPLDISVDIGPCEDNVPENKHDRYHTHEESFSASGPLGMMDSSRSSIDQVNCCAGSIKIADCYVVLLNPGHLYIPA